jgi:hypothetical protein
MKMKPKVKMFTFFFPLLLILTALALREAHAGTYLVDFERDTIGELPKGWAKLCSMGPEKISGDPSVEKDLANPDNKVLKFDKSVSASAYYLEAGAEWNDYTFTFDFLFGQDAIYAWVFWAVQDANNWYTIQFRTIDPRGPYYYGGYAEKGNCPWGQWFEGKPYPNGKIPGAYAPNKWYTGKIILTKNKGWSFYVEDQLVLEHPDTHYTSGSIGFGGQKSDVYFDNINITGKDVPPMAIQPLLKVTTTWGEIKAER